MSNSTRTLPDDQQRIDEDERKDESSLQTMERAEELSSQFETIKSRTVNDGMVLGRLKDIDTSRTSSTIIVSIDLPGEGIKEKKRFDKPKVWSDRYKFVRWIRHYGYTADSFPSMLEDKCKVKVQREGNKEYEVFIPEVDESAVEVIKSAIAKPFSVGNSIVENYKRSSSPDISLTIGFSIILFGIAVMTSIIEVGVAPIPIFGAIIISLLATVVLGATEEAMLQDD